MSDRGLRIVILSSSLLTERMFIHSSFAGAITMKGEAEWHLWTTAVNERRLESPEGLRIEPFPAIRPFREFPYNYLRRFNEYVWDFRLQPPS